MATAKQIAARKLFVKRVRAGEFSKKPSAKRKKNPVSGKSGRTSHNRPNAASKNGAANKSVMRRKSNPAKKTVVRDRAINPAHRAPVGFAVHTAKADGQPGPLLGRFPLKATAVEYARAYVKAHARAVVIVGKGV